MSMDFVMVDVAQSHKVLRCIRPPGFVMLDVVQFDELSAVPCDAAFGAPTASAFLTRMPVTFKHLDINAIRDFAVMRG